MRHTSRKADNGQTRGRFALASAFYVLGVIAYCIWSYHQYQCSMEELQGEAVGCIMDEISRARIIRTVAGGFFLLVTAFLPMFALYRHAKATTAQHTARRNADLQQDFEHQKAREAELEDAIRDLERFNAMAVGRETRIIELKGEVNTLLEQLNRKKRYTIDRVD